MTQPRGAPATLEFALLRGAIEEIPLGIATLRETEILSVNSALERLFDAAPGVLDGRDLTALLDVETIRLLNTEIERRRVFDGRVRARTLAGRELHVELRYERYRSAAAGVGGFLVVRDVTFELGSLGRLVDASGGVIFHVRVPEMAVEDVSPSVADLTGLSCETCRAHPILLADLLSVDERERVAALLRKLVAQETTTASAQVTLRTPGGSRLVHLRATGRRDTSGDVRFVDGVVLPIDAPGSSRRSTAPPEQREDRPRRAMRTGETASTALALVDLGRELLREASKSLHAAVREGRIAKGLLDRARLASEETVDELRARVDGVLVAADAALALNRRVRRAFEATSQPTALREVIAGVAATLEPLFGEPLALEIAGLGTTRLDAHADELALALSYVALRAHRLAGRGKIRIQGGVLIGAEGDEAELEIVSTPPPDPPDEDDGSTDVAVLRRQGQLDRAYIGAQALLSLLGGRIERDEATLSHVTTVVRIPLR